MSQPDEEDTTEHPAALPPVPTEPGSTDAANVSETPPAVAPSVAEAPAQAPPDSANVSESPPAVAPSVEETPDQAPPVSAPPWQAPAGQGDARPPTEPVPTPPFAPPMTQLPPAPPATQQPNQQWQPTAPPQAGQWQQPGQPPSGQVQQPGQWQQPPAQQWQGSPQYPAQPGYPPQGYPPQGYPPQGYPQPGYPQQGYAPAGPMYSTSALVAVAGLLLAVFGLIDMVGGVWLLGQGDELRGFIQRSSINLFGSRLEQETLRSILSPMPGVLLVFGAVEVILAAGIFAHKGWGRALGILLCLLGILIGVASVSVALALAPGFSVPLIGAVVVLLGYAFIVLALIAGGSHFRRRYPQR